MSEWKALATDELLPESPFTDPIHTQTDMRVLQFAVNQLRVLLEDSEMAAQLAAGQQLFWMESEGRIHRLIIGDADGLRRAGQPTLVGFFGQRRAAADHELVDVLDNDLITELLAHEGLLAYCSILLEDGEYGNLVLFQDESAKLHWSTSERHSYATRIVSPKYYESVRLQNGCVPGGVFSLQPARVERTKYLDYRGMLPWRAVREWENS